MARNLDAHSLREALLGLFYRRSAPPKRPARPEVTGRTTIPPTAAKAAAVEERERASQEATPPKDDAAREAEETP